MTMKQGILTVICACACLISAVAAADAPALTPEEKAKQLAAWRQEARDANTAYYRERMVLRSSLQTNNLEGAAAAADKMVELAAWAPPDPEISASLKTSVYATSLDIARQFADKRLYGAGHAVTFYKKAVSATAVPAEKAVAELELAGFLYHNAQVPEAEARQMMQKVLETKGLAGSDLVGLCLARARMCDGVEFDEYIERASAEAGSDGALLLQVLQAQFPQRGDPETIIKSREMLFDIAREALADKRIDKYRYENASPAVPSLTEFLVGRFNGDPFYAYGESIKLLDEALQAAPDAAARNKWRRLQWQTHQRSAARYYAPPDPKAMAAMRDVLLAMLPDQTAGIELARVRLALMDLSHKLGDTGETRKYADELQRDYSKEDQNLPRVTRAANIYRGLMAYDEENYPGVIEYLAPLVEDGEILNSNHAVEVPMTSDRRGFWGGAVEKTIRSYCAVGDYKRAYALKDALLSRISRTDTQMYQAWFDGLEQRAATQNTSK